MSNVLVEKNKLDLLANAIAGKSGEPLTLTLDEMVEAVDGIETGGGGIVPTGNIDITHAGQTDVTNYATATVPTADPLVDVTYGYYTESGQRKFKFTPEANVGISYGHDAGYLQNGRYVGTSAIFNAIPTGTSVTPTESAQTIGGRNYMMEGAVTVNAIPSNYVGSGVTRRSSSDVNFVEDGEYYAVVDDGYYANPVWKEVPSGTAGTPTATKGTVSNHSISVTPSVTNEEGWIQGGTKTGTAVTVSASELVSGSETKTENGTYNVTNLAELVVDVQGGGGSIAVDYKEASGTNTSSIAFTGLSGRPTSFVIFSTSSLSTSTPSKVATVVYDGTSTFADTITNTSNAQVTYVGNGFSFSYANGTLTVTSAGESFTADSYVLAYTYGGNSVSTKDVQVGSGATSITFTGLEGAPLYWSCAFKSNFSTSSGYQRAITILNVAGATVGLAMDSGAHYSDSYWTSSYSNGTLTITSQSANAGGYFHQPGYYQLTYAVDESAPSYQSKTVTPTTSQQVVTADSGYDALSQVTVNAMPSMTLPSSTSATSSGTNKATISASSSTQYLNIPTGYNATAQYYTISASGGGGGANIATETTTNSSNQNTSISFTLPSGRTPKAFFARLTSQIARSSNSRYYYVFDMRWDGSSTGGVAGNTFYMYSGTLTNVTSGYSYSQSGTTFTLSSTGSRSASPGSFYNGTYELVYVY